MSALISFWLYITPPRVSAASAIVLVRRLINAAPADLTEGERDALRRMREQAVTVQSIEKTRERLRPENLKEEDRLFDGYWGVLKDQVFSWLRVEGTPQYAIAARLREALFPRGLDFVTLSYEQEWYESGKRLERIVEEALEALIDQLVHPTVLPLVREAHRSLGEGLGVGETPIEVTNEEGLRTALRDLSLSVSDYARVLSTSVKRDDGRARPASSRRWARSTSTGRRIRPRRPPPPPTRRRPPCRSWTLQRRPKTEPACGEILSHSAARLGVRRRRDIEPPRRRAGAGKVRGVGQAGDDLRA